MYALRNLQWGGDIIPYSSGTLTYISLWWYFSTTTVFYSIISAFSTYHSASPKKGKLKKMKTL